MRTTPNNLIRGLPLSFCFLDRYTKNHSILIKKRKASEGVRSVHHIWCQPCRPKNDGQVTLVDKFDAPKSPTSLFY
jgi:hypothetical protein